MVYCAAFDCNANSIKNKVTCSWFPMELTLKKSKHQADEAQPALLASRKLVSTAIWTSEGGICVHTTSIRQNLHQPMLAVSDGRTTDDQWINQWTDMLTQLVS